MKAHTASLINAITLIACSVWGYVAIGGASFTALIPAGFGIALVLCYRGLAAENKAIAHIAAVITLIVLVALYMPFSSAMGSGDALRILRSVLMLGTTVLAMVFFIKSFRDARKARLG